MVSVSKPTKIIPRLAWYPPFEPFAFGFLRFATGAIIAVQGYGRLLLGRGASEVGAYLTGVSPTLLGGFELVAGVLLAIGLFVRPVAVLVALEWAAMAIVVPVPPGGSWLLLGASLHYPAMIAAFAVAFVVTGGGRPAVDDVLGFGKGDADEVSPWGHFIIRVSFGLMFLPAGIDKVFYGGWARISAGNITMLGLEPTWAWAWLVAGVELGGAILLTLGLFVRPMAFAILIELIVIVAGISSRRGYFWTGNGAEIALLMACAAFALVLAGAGRYSIDHAHGREF